MTNRPPVEATEIGRVVVVDDHLLHAETLAALLRHRQIDAISVTAATPAALRDLILDRHPAVAVLDFSLGELGTAIPLIRPLVRHGIRVVVVSGDDDPMITAHCLEAGAATVLGKTTTPDEVIDALAGAVAGVRLVPNEERFALLSDMRVERARIRQVNERFDRLSPRETEVYALVCAGLGAAEIARASYVSLATVRSQIRSVLAKLEVTSQLAAVAEAHRYGWVDRLTYESSIVAKTSAS